MIKSKAITLLCQMYLPCFEEIEKQALTEAIQALEEIQQYHELGEITEIIGQQYELQEFKAIGTVEEFKALKEKSEPEPKEVIHIKLKDNMRKFPPNTKVRFTGTIQQLAECIDPQHPDLDGAKAVMYDGGIGIILDSQEFADVSEICYDVEFGNTECHWHIIPEKYLDFV